MSELQMVYGEECLSFIDRPIGLIATDFMGRSNTEVYNNDDLNVVSRRKTGAGETGFKMQYSLPCTISKVAHNISKRKIGVVLNRYEDGGIHVAILGDETIDNRTQVNNYSQRMTAGAIVEYHTELSTLDHVRNEDFNGYPTIGAEGDYIDNGTNGGVYLTAQASSSVGFDELLDYTPDIDNYGYVISRSLIDGWTLSNNVNNTMHFGEGMVASIKCVGELMNNPINYISGDLYSAIFLLSNSLGNLFPNRMDASTFDNYSVEIGNNIDSFNQCAIPFNLILTENVQYAQAYITNGTVPPDAFLYPLDWSNLPPFDNSEEINPDDVPNNNTPDDNDRIVTPNLPVVPSFTPSQFSNYNWYWLSVSEYSDFINWFWHDVGMSTSFDSIIAKIEGLYNNLSSAVIMARYYPVDYEWITGINISQAPTDPIKVGMIQKAGTVTTIDQSHPMPIRLIGRKKIPNKYDSFMDLSPYSQLSLYLPFHGFVDLDINIFSGHYIYVYGVYDYLTGTLQYMLYYDDSALINTFVVKLAVDIPITLQTKNDRDSSAFQNVSSVVGGLIGAGAGIMSGNPIGIAMGVTQGVQAFNSANASAPLNVRGTVGESGALYAPPQCAIILRRPTIQPSDKGKKLTTWIKDVGQLCGYGCKLSGLSGYTQCAEPRIDFTKTTPLQSEVEEIYNYLKEGVII